MAKDDLTGPYYVLKCESCGRKLQVETSARGVELRCPSCFHPYQIPAVIDVGWLRAHGASVGTRSDSAQKFYLAVLLGIFLVPLIYWIFESRPTPPEPPQPEPSLVQTAPASGQESPSSGSQILPDTLQEGIAYRLSRETPLCAERHPSDPLAALATMQGIAPGGVILVLQADRSTTWAPWYRVRASDATGGHIGEGWVNSGALVGQELVVVTR